MRICLAGFIVLQPHWQDKKHILALIHRVLPLLKQKPFRKHQLWIVEESRLRIRTGESKH